MTTANTDFGVVAQDLQRAAGAFALLTSSATLFGSALGDFREFERALTQTNAIAGGTATSFDRMADAAVNFSLIFTTSALDAVSALQNLAQAGFNTEESLQALSGVLLLAQATFTDVAFASDVLTANIRAFGLAASDTTRVANVLAAATTSSLATLDKLAFAFRQVAPVANIANLSIEETTALLNQLFNVGLRGEQAGTALRNIIIRLVRPLGEAQDILRSYGIATRDAAGDLLPLVDIFNQLREAGVSNAELARIFETEALAGVVTLLAATATQAGETQSEYEKALDAISGTDKALEIAVQNIDTFEGSMRLLQNAVIDLKRELGENLAGPIRFFADGLRSLIETFQSLSEPTQNFILVLGSITVAALAALAAINAFVLLFGGVAFKAVTKLGTALFGVEKVMGNTTRSAGLITKAFRAMVSIFGRVVTALGPAIAALGRFISIAASLTPQGRIIRGLVTLGALLATTAVDWANWGNAAEKALKQADMEQFEAGGASVALVAREIIPDEELNDLEKRIEFGRNLLDATRGQSPADNIATGTRQGLVFGNVADEVRQTIEELRAEFPELEKIVDEREAIIARFNQLQRANEAGEFGSVLPDFTNRPLTNALEEFTAGLDQDLQGAIDTFDTEVARLERNAGEAEAVAKSFVELRGRSVEEFLDALRDPETQELAGGDFEILNERIEEVLQNTDVYNAALEYLRNIPPGEQPSQADFVTAILTATGDAVDADILVAAFKAIRGQDFGLVSEELRTFNAESAAEAKELQVELERAFSESSLDLAEAVRAAQFVGQAELQAELEDVTSSNESGIQNAISNIGVLQSEEIQRAFAEAAEEFGFAVNELAGLEEIFSGRLVMENIYAQIDADTTPAEMQAIANAEFEKWRDLIDFVVENVINGLDISDENKSALATAGNNVLATINSIVLGAITGIQNTVEETTDRITKATTPKPKRGGGGGAKGKSPEQLAKEALRDARKIEDAFTEAEKAVVDAKVSFAENAFGLAPNARASTLLGLDIEQIEADFDKQIQRLERKLEDLEIDFKGSPSQLKELQAQTREAIRLTEMAKQAEIDAASSFEAQMQRRSDALDLFIRDLETLAFQTEDTFSKVAAGIGKAFAEYQKDLVTLVDITANAVTGFLDTITTGVADFIFDNENAWENFKANMLNISREIFEGFTKALLQQVISSITDGGGSIFGNALQPSAVGGAANSETPGVGTGGFLGGLFGGGQEQQAGGVNAQPIQAGVQQVSQVLTQGATQIQGAIQQLTSATSSGGSQQRGAANQAANDTRQGGQVVGQSFQQAGQTIGSAANTAATTIQAGAAGGGGGSFFGSILSAGIGLLGFAKGGMVSDRPINNFIRHYAEGGKITGPGTGTSDDILAWLSNNEFVVNAKSTSEFLPLLEAINSGALKGDTAKMLLAAFRDGGRVNSRTQAPAFSQGGLVGDTSFGTPSVNLTAPRTVLVGAGTGSSSNTNINNSRGGDTVNINVSYTDRSGGESGGSKRGRKSADQLAKRIGAQIERSKKNT